MNTSKPDAEEILRSATIAAKAVLACEAHPWIKKMVLKELFWKITERNGKHNLRFESEGGRLLQDKKSGIHEHVVEMAELIRRAISGQPIEELVEMATGCLVTKNEHEVLGRQKGLSGWERYKAAGIRVFDKAEKNWVW